MHPRIEATCGPVKPEALIAAIEALPLDLRQFLSLKDDFLDLYTALKITRRTAEAAGRIAPDGPVTRAHDALRAKLELIEE